MGPTQLVAPARTWYRQFLKQARLLAFVWQDPVLYASHRTIAKDIAQKLRNDIHAFEKHKRQQQERLLQRSEANPGVKLDHLDKQVCTAEGKEKDRLVRVRARARKKLKQLAAANVGWPHAVERALDQAYGRTGPIRWNLLRPFLPKHDVQTGRLKASKKTGKPTAEPKAPLPRRQQSPTISPSLRSLLLSGTAHKGSNPNQSHLELPPKLVLALKKKSGLYPSENEAVAMLQGAERNLQAVGITRRREANARWRWLTSHITKLQPPIESERNEDPMQGPLSDDPGRQVGVIEAKIMDRHPNLPARVRRDLERQEGALLHGSESGDGRHRPPTQSPPYLSSARQLAAELGRGDEENLHTPETEKKLAQATRKAKFKWKEPSQLEMDLTRPSYNLVHHGGWSRSGFIDYERDHRARRRVWQHLLQKIPKAVYPSSAPADQARSHTEDDQFRSAEMNARRSSADDVSQGTEASFVELALPHNDNDDSGGPRATRHLTLQARSQAYQLVPAREWRFWTDYGHSISDKGAAKQKQGGPSTKLVESEYAHVNPVGPRPVRPDTARWTRPDELAFLD
ncbi:hypothetical protein OC861_002876 [Tilletia horrida]|nr:hypothetical protein OC861_002876 [Tilletia horrida]